MLNVCYITFLQVAQVCAYELGIPMETVNVKATNSMTSSNSITTGGSITSMNCCEVNYPIFLSTSCKMYLLYPMKTGLI